MITWVSAISKMDIRFGLLTRVKTANPGAESSGLQTVRTRHQDETPIEIVLF